MSQITCPIHTNTQMRQTQKYGITIDWCPTCGGVWLDKGELEKMIELAKQESVATNSNAPFQDEDDNDNDYRHGQSQHHHKRKKRFENPLEDLFDIF